MEQETIDLMEFMGGVTRDKLVGIKASVDQLWEFTGGLENRHNNLIQTLIVVLDKAGIKDTEALKFCQ